MVGDPSVPSVREKGRETKEEETWRRDKKKFLAEHYFFIRPLLFRVSTIVKFTIFRISVKKNNLMSFTDDFI